MSKHRIGIFPGAFDPVHAGHITFALQAIKTGRLDRVYFMPERRPRYKPDIEHFGHRTAMITRAIQPHTKLALLELPDIYFTNQKTLPKLQQEFKGSQLFILMGSDVALTMGSWLDLEKLLGCSELLIGMRADQSEAMLEAGLRSLPVLPKYKLIKSPLLEVSSGSIRRALRKNMHVAGLLASVARYARHHWLYVSVSQE